MNRIRKIIKIFYFVLALLMLFGIIFGPISWIQSSNFHRAYESFENGATTVNGKVVSKRTESAFRSHTFYVSVKFVNQGKTYRSEISVQAPLWDEVYVTQSVPLLYNPAKEIRVKLKMENEPQFLPPILKDGLGKWTTIISCLLLVLQISFKHSINRFLKLKVEPTPPNTH